MKLILFYLVAFCIGLPVSLYGQYTIENPPPAPPYVHPVPLDSGWSEITGLIDFEHKAPCLNKYDLYNSVYDSVIDEEILRRNQYGFIIRDSVSYFKYRNYGIYYTYGDSIYINCDTIGYSVNFPKVNFEQHDLLFYKASCGGCDLPTSEGHLYVNHAKKQYLFFVQLGYWGDCMALSISHHELILPKLNPTYLVKFKRILKARN